MRMSHEPACIFRPPGRETTYRPGFPPAGSEGGQAIAEFAFAFPLQLLIIFSIMQLASIYVARQVVTYASYSAARAALVAESADEALTRAAKAGAIICAPITGDTGGAGSFENLELSGWGPIPKSGVSYGLKTHVSRLVRPDIGLVYPDADTGTVGNGEVEVTLTHYYELQFPIVNHIFGWAGRLRQSGDYSDATGAEGTAAQGDEVQYEAESGIWNIGAPHMRLRHTTRLALPGGPPPGMD